MLEYEYAHLAEYLLFLILVDFLVNKYGHVLQKPNVYPGIRCKNRIKLGNQVPSDRPQLHNFHVHKEYDH